MGLLDAFRKRKPDPNVHDLTKPIQVPETSKIIGGKRYSSLDANCIASGSVNIVAYGWLMQTSKGSFFLVAQGFLGGILVGPPHVSTFENDEQVKAYYEGMTFQLVPYETVFPGSRVVDA
jgi:hypothetical protein